MLEPQVVRRMLDEAVFVGQGLEHTVVCSAGCHLRHQGL